MPKPPWRVLASSYIVDNRFLRLRSDTIELADGSVIADYYVRESRGFVVIFALTGDRQAVLVRQYKHGIAQELLELPAGAIDPGETPLEAAGRELQEETGYSATELQHVRSFIVDPTNADTIAHLFFAPAVTKAGPQHLDPTENIRVETVDLERLRNMVADGTIDSMPHVATIYVMLERLGRLNAF